MMSLHYLADTPLYECSPTLMKIRKFLQENQKIFLMCNFPVYSCLKVYNSRMLLAGHSLRLLTFP